MFTQSWEYKILILKNPAYQILLFVVIDGRQNSIKIFISLTNFYIFDWLHNCGVMFRIWPLWHS